MRRLRHAHARLQIYNLDLTDSHCIKYSISKGLGLGIVLGGGIVKVPQILKIVKSKSARGVSFTSYLLDTMSLIIVVAYNVRQGFPLSTYGENIALMIQNFVIACLILLYNPKALPSSLDSQTTLTTRRKPPYSAIFTFLALSGISLYCLLSENITSISSLKTLVKLSIPVSLSAKLPQITENYKNKSTGQLSAFLVLNSLAGCLARVFTTQTETGDSVIWWSFMLAAILNGVVACQMGYYWKEKEGLTVKEKEKREDLLEKAHSVTVDSGKISSAPASPRLAGTTPRKVSNWTRKAD